MLCSPPAADSGDERNSELERFIRNKYEYRTYAIAPAPSPPPRQPDAQSNGLAPTAASPTPPPAYTAPSAAPSIDRSAPPLPNRPRSASSSVAFAPSPAVFASQAGSPGPDLPPRSATSSTASRLRSKSVRFPEAPPTVIPSPPDSEDEGGGERRPVSRPPSAVKKGILRFRRDEEILVDWAAFTSPISGNPGDDDDRGEEEDDVPLGSLGALGMRGAQVGMIGVPVQAWPGGSDSGGYAQMPPGQTPGQGPWTPSALHQHLEVPYGASVAQHTTGGGVPALPPGAVGGNGGQQVPTVAPLQPQYTGSAKGYLHQQRQQQNGGAGGFDAFQQMFQPPAPPPPQQQQQPAPPAGIETNPFRSHLFARNAYSPSPQPQQQQHLYQQQQQQQQQPPPPSPYQPAPRPSQPAPPSANDIWADLDFLSLGGTGSAPSATTTNRNQDQQPPPPHAPAPLRPQLTGFVPSSSFGQQLARETGGGSSPAPFASTSNLNGNGNGVNVARTAPSLTLQIPNGGGRGSGTSSPALFGTGSSSNTPLAGSNSHYNDNTLHQHPHPSPMPAPAPLRPQLTGFVPSSSFGQELARSSFLGPGAAAGSASSSPSLAATGGTPQPLQPQRTGFVPSSKFGLELAKESAGGAAGATGGSSTPSYFPTLGGATHEPAPFDPSPTASPAGAAPNGGTDAFAPFSTDSFNGAAPQPPHQAPLQQQKANPFLRPQLTGYMPQQQQQQQPPPSFGGGGAALQPQLTGFAGTNGHAGYLPQQQQPPPQQQQQQPPRPTNPFLAFGAAGGGQGWR